MAIPATWIKGNMARPVAMVTPSNLALALKVSSIAHEYAVQTATEIIRPVKN